MPYVLFFYALQSHTNANAEYTAAVLVKLGVSCGKHIVVRQKEESVVCCILFPLCPVFWLVLTVDVFCEDILNHAFSEFQYSRCLQQ